MLELLAVAWLAMMNPDREDDALLGSVLMWMTATVLFYTGLQKVLYGTYFDARFLGFMVAADDRRSLG